MENFGANIKNLSKNKIYLILIGLAVVIFATVLIYAYVEFSGTKISVVPNEEGKPYCGAIGSRSEGWYVNSDSNRPELIRWDNCNGCFAICKAIGTRSEGWYSSCDEKLIKYDNCSTANIECKTDKDCKGVKCPGVYCDNGKCVCPPITPTSCYSDSDCYGIKIPTGKEEWLLETTFNVVPVMIQSLRDGHHAEAEKINDSELRIIVEGKEIEAIKKYEWVKKITKRFSQFCEFPEGTCKGPGQCTEKSEICTMIYAPICGCDNKTYSNNCMRQSAGVSKKHNGRCGEEKQTCNEKCKSLNYKSGICRMSCETWNNETDMGHTSDCNPPCPPGMACPAVMYDCCCQKESQEDCAKEGEQVNRNPLMGSTDQQCCAGLIENRVSKSYSICEKSTDCTGEGEKNYFGKPPCCEGFTKIANAVPYDGEYIAPTDGSALCTKCGDGICKSPENICNCPKDCEEEIDCIPESNTVNTSGMQKCCAGLKAISCAQPNSQGECHNEDFNCDSFPCANCGNGICGLGENKCNCPEDCKEETGSITITSPNGGEELEKGRYYTIDWKSGQGIDIHDKLDIYLVDESKESQCTLNGKCCYTCSNWKRIITPLANFGEYRWEIPIDQETGNKYKIYIRTLSDGNDCFKGCVEDKSDNYFSIVEKKAHLCTDTDGGKDYYKKGTVTLRDLSSNEILKEETDYCEGFDNTCETADCPGMSDIMVTEYYCENNEIKSESHNCPNKCKEGACIIGDEPYCSAIGSRSEGWVGIGISGIKYENCNGCHAVCEAIGSKSEGWYSSGSCETTGKLIKYDNCAEGETLSADLNCDGNVNLTDVAILLSFWGKDPSGSTSCKSPDINQDGKVNLADFSIMMSQWTK